MRVGAADPDRAVEQHAQLIRELERAGATVTAVPFVHGAFDSVFMKDNAVVVEREGSRRALLAMPKHDERRQEQHARADAMRALGIDVLEPLDAPLEGGDVVMAPSARGAFLGYGFRSSRRAAGELERFIDAGVTCLELRDARLYHLDMVLSVLDDGTALVCEEAMTPASFHAVATHPAVRGIVRVPLAEALAFGANLVQVGRTIVWGADAPATAAELERRGYAVAKVALDQFHLAGGSAACLVSRVHRQSAAERANAA